MAHKCDKCGDVIATSDAFVRHWVSCSGGSNGGEGDRAQPTSKGKKGGAARPAAASASSKGVGRGSSRGEALEPSPEGFQCPICDDVLSNRFNFHRHLTRSHKFTKKEADSERDKLQGDPRATCKHCGTEMLKRQLPVHYQTCKKVPRAVPKATTSQDLNVSRDSLVSRAGNLVVTEEPEVMSEDQFLEGFTKYMKNKDQGNLSGKTPETYMGRIQNFLNFWKGQKENFSVGKLGNFGSKVNFTRLPHPELWVGTLGKATSKNQGISAYIMLIKYLKFLNFHALDQEKMDEDEVYRREGHLNRLHTEAKERIKNLNSQVNVERMENEEDRENLPEGDSQRKIPGEELQRISNLYATSELRETMYRDLGEKMEEVLRRNNHTPTDVRDFCAFEVLFESGGMRSDAIYKMKLKELYRAKQVGDGKRAILGHEQKTKNSYGAAQLIIPERLYNLLLLYVKHARPLLFVTEKKPEGDDYVFISQTSKTAPKANRLYSMSRCTKFFEKVNEANDGTYKTRCHDFRRLVATLAQEHDDPTVRESQPLLMGHSKSTVDLHYRSRTSKLAQHASNIDQLWAPAQGGDNLPSVEVDGEEIEEERLRIESEAQEKRDKEKGERDRKRRAAAPRVEGKFQFAAGDHDIIRRAFEFAKDCDGNQLGTITLAQGKHKTRSHFYQAYDSKDRDREFRRMVDRLAGEFDGQIDRNGREINFAYIRTKIGDAYHAMFRKGKKSGKAKGPQPGTSKSAKNPAKKRRRGDDDSDSEDEDSSEFSGEESE